MSSLNKEQQSTLPIFITVVLCTLPHLLHVSVPVAILCIAMWGYHLASLYYSLPRPGLKVRTLAGPLLFIVAFASNEGLTVESFISLLALMIALKLFELRSGRDGVVAVILSYFIIVSGMFFNNSIGATLYIIFTIFYNTAVLIHIQFAAIGLSRCLRLTLLLTLRALPFMLLLFFFFPRIQIGLWKRPPMISVTSGFSEEISLGSVARLAQSDKVAFRVNFQENTQLPMEQLYWRGIVLWQLDGNTWKRGVRTNQMPKFFAREGQKIKYNVTLEPHNENWLFALDLPVAVAAPMTWMRADYSLYRWRKVNNRLSYTVTSNSGAQPRLHKNLLQNALQLPLDDNRRARSLAHAWKTESQTKEEIVNRALDYFQTNAFMYTIEPGARYDNNSLNQVDNFLFSERKGFCEHFAASFAYLMRAAGVPARLVGGYLGGQKNPYGDYWIIRQSDAHVWVEVLLDGEIWQRVDPTSVVAPERIYPSDDGLLDEVTSLPWLSLFGINQAPQWLQKSIYAWDLLNLRWNQWIMEYSYDSQIRLLSKLGIDIRLNKGVAQIVLIIVVLLASTFFLTLVFFRPQDHIDNEAAKYWLFFCKKLEKAGIVRTNFQGPLSYLATVEQQRPDLYKNAKRIVALYIDLRYRNNEDPAIMHSFRNAVKKFTVKRQQEVRSE